MGCIDSDNYEDEWDEMPLFKGGLDPEWGGRTTNKDYVLQIRSDLSFNIRDSIANVQFTLYGPDGIEVTNCSHKLIDVYEKEINNDNNFSFIDGDHDRFLTRGDGLIIKSVDHVDDDGRLSPGPGEPNCIIVFEEMKLGGRGKLFSESIS